jgi:hypothetical protein
MSLAIDVERVSAVQITGQWYDVLPTADGVSSFSIDAYEFVWDHGEGNIEVMHGGGENGICSKGAIFKHTLNEWIAVPFDRIQAVKVNFSYYGKS